MPNTCCIEPNLLKTLYVAAPVSREVIALLAMSKSMKSNASGKHVQYPAACRVSSSRLGMPLRATPQKSSFFEPTLTPHGTDITVGMVPVEVRRDNQQIGRHRMTVQNDSIQWRAYLGYMSSHHTIWRPSRKRRRDTCLWALFCMDLPTKHLSVWACIFFPMRILITLKKSFLQFLMASVGTLITALHEPNFLIDPQSVSRVLAEESSERERRIRRGNTGWSLWREFIIL